MAPTATDRRRTTRPALTPPATKPSRRWPLIAATVGVLLAAIASAGFVAFLAGGAHKAAAHQETLDLSASLAPSVSPRPSLARRSHSARRLSQAESRLAGGDTQAVAALSRMSLDSLPRRRGIAALVAALRREAGAMHGLATTAGHGDRSAYTRSLAQIPAVQTSLRGAFQSARALGFSVPALRVLSTHALALPAPVRHASHCAARSVATTTVGTASSPTPAATTPKTPVTPTVAPTYESSAPPVSHGNPTHDSSPQYGPTVVSPPAR